MQVLGVSKVYRLQYDESVFLVSVVIIFLIVVFNIAVLIQENLYSVKLSV